MNNKEMLEIERLSKKYNENNIPLYVSYPTTSWWKNKIDEDVYINTFKNSSLNFLYIHFPYCKKSCYYCCCYREVAKGTEDNDLYISYLKKEIKKKVNKIGVNEFRNIKNIHWGGGTPTYLTCSQIEEVFNSMSEMIDYNKDNSYKISIEAYPDKDIVTKEKLKCLKALGFTHISFGIQDFDQHIQKTINRSCTENDFDEIVNNAKNEGLKVNVDLCYGLPYQGLNEVSNAVKKVLQFEPERVSVFPYVHFPLVFPLQRLIPGSSIPNSFIMTLLLNKTISMFEENGYKKVGYDHFVKNDVEIDTIRDFMGQSDINNRNFIGIGSSAISFNEKYFFHNVLNVKDYYKLIDDDKMPLLLDKSCILTDDDLLRNKLILKSILTDFKIDKGSINKEFNIDFDKYFENELKILANYEKDGLVEGIKTSEINITEYGRLFARHISYIFDNYYNS